MTYLATILQSFFTDYVHTQRSLSANTIASYRDTWRIFIKHLTTLNRVCADELRLDHLDRATVTGFLAYLMSGLILRLPAIIGSPRFVLSWLTLYPTTLNTRKLSARSSASDRRRPPHQHWPT